MVNVNPKATEKVEDQTDSPMRLGGNISPIHTFVNIPALIRQRSVFLSSGAGILTIV
jgi:hypothetical protein